MSSIPSPGEQSPATRTRRSWRWAAILSLSVLLHVFAFDWAKGHISLPSLQKEQETVITTALLTERKPIAPPAPAVETHKPKPKPKPKPKTKPRPAPPQPAALPEQPTEAIAPVDVPPAAGPGDLAPTATPPAAEPPPAESAPTDATAQPAYQFDPPPSAELSYDVQALREGQQWYGSGMFQWTAGGDSYRIVGEASVTILFKITVLNFTSEGMINGYGIAPVLYTEKPWRKSMSNTHFRHADGKISFSASEAVFPYKGGEQDRASIMWQLAGIGRGDASQFVPGATLEVVVAGARRAETWRIDVIGQEEIDTGRGKMLAWHVARSPLEGSYDQKIDIWLAPQHEWYPVKLRYTYANGDHLDMVLSDLKQTVPASQAVQ